MKKINVRELVEKYQSNCDRIGEIADTIEKENRERNEAEEAEFKQLTRQNEVLSMKLRAAEVEGRAQERVDADTYLRERLIKDGKEVTILLTRDIMTTAGLANTGIIPTDQQEMLKPLRAGLIWDKVGLPVRSGLVGKLRWPKHGKAVAAWADEAAALVDSSINFDKLEMSGVRLGIAIPVSREELTDSEGIVEGVVREEMPAACIDAINAALFTTVGTYTDGETTKNKKVVGPFVEGAKPGNLITFAGSVPTRKELLLLKSKVTKAGIKLSNPGWVMREDLKNELEDAKVDAGSGRFVCENDMILGSPVFCTDAIEAGYVGFGDWSYQAAGFFGPISMVVDPYTLARKNSTDFVLNMRFGTATLRQEAFAVGKVKA